MNGGGNGASDAPQGKKRRSSIARLYKKDMNDRSISHSNLKDQLRQNIVYNKNSSVPCGADNRYLFPRLVRRNLPYSQSNNHFQVENAGVKNSIRRLLLNDWFHIILRNNIVYSTFWLLLLWTIVIIVYAVVYMLIDRSHIDSDCGLALPGESISFGPAFAFSLETCTTVGYGLPSGSNSFFEDECGLVQFVIYLQMVFSMLFNAFLFAFFYSKIAKTESRGIQVVFGNQAIIKYNPYTEAMELQIRCYDVDARHPVVEAHIRLYVVTKSSPMPKPLRVVDPNDDFGSVLLLSLPTIVNHHIDYYSLLAPHNDKHYATGASIKSLKGKSNNMHPWALNKNTRMHLRSIDGATNSRDDWICPICSESYGTLERLTNHIRYNQMVEEHDEYEVEGSHLSINLKDIPKDPSSEFTIRQIQDYFKAHICEIICVVEGIDPLNSGTFQALQSYRFEDVVFGQVQFADCVEAKQKVTNTNTSDDQMGKKLIINLENFHSIIPENYEEKYCIDLDTTKEEESKHSGRDGAESDEKYF